MAHDDIEISPKFTLASLDFPFGEYPKKQPLTGSRDRTERSKRRFLACFGL
jgi:hypothetical protein